MKRLVCILICLLLTPFAARAAQGDRTVLSGENVYGLTALGDEAYILTRTAVTRWVPDGEPERLPLEEPVGGDGNWDWSAFFAAGNRLMALQEVDGETGFFCMRLCELTPGENVCEVHVLRELDWEDLTEETDGWVSAWYLYAAAAQGNWLFLIAAGPGDRTELWRLNLTGDGAPIRSEAACTNPISLCAAPDGALWISGMDGEGTTLWRYDPGLDAAWQAATLSEEPLQYAGSLAVDGAGETLYYRLGGEIRARSLTGGGEETAARLSGAGLLDASACLLSDKYYVATAGCDGVVARNVRPESGEVSGGSLVLLDPQLSYALSGVAAEYSAQHPELDVFVSTDEDLTEEEIVGMLLTRSDEWDLMLLDAQSDAYVRARDRGFLCELDTPALRALSSCMIPALREGFSHAGSLCALPVRLGAGSDFAVNRAVLARLGLTEDDLPQTLEGLLRFLSEKLPEMLPEDMSAFPTDVGWQGIRLSLALKILRRAEDHGEEQLLALLNLLDGIDSEALHMEGARDEALFERFGVLSMGAEWGRRLPLFMGLEEGETPVVGLSGTVLVVNPFSNHLEEALGLRSSPPHGWTAKQPASCIRTNLNRPPTLPCRRLSIGRRPTWKLPGSRATGRRRNPPLPGSNRRGAPGNLPGKPSSGIGRTSPGCS